MQILPNAKSQFIDSAGQPLASGTVGFYFPGTLNPKPTFQDAAGTIANTNPVALDSRGQALIWGSGVYRQIVKDASGVTIWDQVTEDANAGLTGNITDAKFVSGVDFTPGITTQLTLPVAPASAANIWAFFDAAYQADDQYSVSGTTLTLNSPIPVGVQEVNVKIGSTIAIGTVGNGSVTDASVAADAAIQSSKLSFLQGGGGAIARTIQSKLQDLVSVLDFGADPTGVADSAPAFRRALAAVAYGGTLYIPTGKYLLDSAVNNAILDFTPFPNKGVTIQGEGWTLKTGGSFSFGSGAGPQGSILQIGTNIASTTDFLHQAPTDLVIGGVAWKDFAIVASTGAYGTPHGQNGFNIDGTANANGYIENLVMDNVFIDNFAAGSSILVNGIGNAQGVLAGAEFRNSKFMNFYAPGFGDSNTIRNNVIGANAGVTGAVGINFYNVSGATNTRILNNDMVNFNGMILCNGATKLIIDGNEFEQPDGFANSLGAMISLNGANGAVDTPTITNNSIAQNSAIANYIPLVVGNSNGAKISGNRISTLSAYNQIQINNNSSYALLEADNQSWVNGVVQDGVAVLDNGVKSMLRACGWTAYTPVVSASTGAFTSVTATGAYQLIDTRTLKIRMSIVINTVGTASGTVNATLPGTLTAAALQAVGGKEIANTGKGLSGDITVGGGTIAFSDAAGASIIGAGNQLVISGTIEIQ